MEQLVRNGFEHLCDKRGPPTVQSALSVVALGRNAVKLGALIIDLDSSEVRRDTRR
jgi:hypothetical protein